MLSSCLARKGIVLYFLLSRLLENASLITNALEAHTYVSFCRRLFSLRIYHQDIKMTNENNQASKTLSGDYKCKVSVNAMSQNDPAVFTRNDVTQLIYFVCYTAHCQQQTKSGRLLFIFRNIKVTVTPPM